MQKYIVQIPLRNGNKQFVDFKANSLRSAKTQATKLIQNYYSDDGFVADPDDMKATKWEAVDSMRWMSEYTEGNAAWIRQVTGCTIKQFSFHADQHAILQETN